MSAAAPRKFGMGAPVRRIEDRSLITGHGRYTDDVAPPGTLRALIVRSQVGHGRFRVGDLAAARAEPGVHLVWTHADLPPGLGDLPVTSLPEQPDGSQPDIPPRPVLCADTVRHVGDPIAIIVADDLEAAHRASALIDIDYDILPAAIDMTAAIADGAPLVWPERGTNVGFENITGSPQRAVDAAFAKAARVVRIEVVNNRLVANYLEPRGILAEYDADTERFTLTLGTQGGHEMRDLIAEAILGVPAESIRVITPDVGGGFGPKAFVFSEYPLAALAARALGRPVKWIGERTEHFLADAQGRDNLTSGELALDADGRFLALRVDLLSNLGAYFSQYGASVATGGVVMSPGPYAIPLVGVRVRGILTNTVPTDAYRGAGRPEAAYLIERLVDLAGRETGLGPVEIRRRNLVAQAAMPHRTATGATYDSGDFAGHLDRALAIADQAGFPARAAAAKAREKLRGFGIGCYIEACAFPGQEPATLRLEPDGGVTLLIGTQTNGQGHATAYAQFVADRLGLDIERVRVIQGDTDQVAEGSGTAGSRSIPIGAVSVDRAAVTLAGKIRAIAARVLEADPDQLDLSDGFVRVTAGNRTLSFAEVAAAAPDPELRTAKETYRQRVSTYPNGTHIAEVEIDPETGTVAVVAYTTVDDFGVTVNPILLAGQIHGGIAQGLGQALLEHTVYDPDGQLLSASFLDYALPRAADLPFIAFETRNIPCETNALGIKGAGEAGTVGAAGAIANAVIDALAGPYGIRHLDMPFTPSRVWTAIHTR